MAAAKQKVTQLLNSMKPQKYSKSPEKTMYIGELEQAENVLDVSKNTMKELSNAEEILERVRLTTEMAQRDLEDINTRPRNIEVQSKINDLLQLTKRPVNY